MDGCCTPRALALLERALRPSSCFAADNGAIRVYASSTIGNYIMPEIIARYRHDFPDLAGRGRASATAWTSSTPSPTCGWIRPDWGPCHAADIIAEPWLEDELVVFAAPNSPLLAGR